MSAKGLPIQPVDATLSVFKGKEGVYDKTSRVFLRLHCGRETGDFWQCVQDLGIQTQQKE
jgi:hypothetical protein